MSRSVWRCRNPDCPAPHGAVLGHLTTNGCLVLDRGVMRFRAYLDTRRAVVLCPACGTLREFRGGAICTPRFPADVA